MIFRAALLFSLLIAFPAHASTANVSGGTLTLADSGSEENAYAVLQEAPGQILVRDTKIGLFAGTGCLAVVEGIRCSGVTAVEALLGPGNDSYTDAGLTVNFRAIGGAGADVVTTATSGGRVRMDGGTENDTLVAGENTGRVDLRGEAGDDDVRNLGSSGGRIGGGSGIDQLRGGGGREKLRGGSGDDSIFGGGSRDRMFGENGVDRLTGGDGRDLIKSGAGQDRVFARDGLRDTIHCTFSDDALSVDRDLDELIGCR